MSDCALVICSAGNFPCAASHSRRFASQFQNAGDLSAFCTSFRRQAMMGPAFSGLPGNSAMALSVQSRAFSPLLLIHSECHASLALARLSAAL
jgi:hypothetical protein